MKINLYDCWVIEIDWKDVAAIAIAFAIVSILK